MGQSLCCIHSRPKALSGHKNSIHNEDIHLSNAIPDVKEKLNELSSGRTSRAETLVDTPPSLTLDKSSSMGLSYCISNSQSAFFEERGYLIIEDCLSVKETQQLQKWVQEVHDLPRTSDCSYIPYEEVNASGERVLCRTENFANTHQEFGGLLKGPKLLGILEQLIGDEMLLFKEKINFKLAGSGGFQPHVDRTGYGDFKRLQHLAILIAADDATAVNGCLEVVEGSHKMDVPIGSDNCIMPEWVASQKWITVEMKAGEMMIFGSSLAHRSGPNASTKDRRAVYATYNPRSEGDLHDAYYERRAKLYPATHKRMEGVDYSSGAQNYAYGTPMRSIEKVSNRL